MLSKPLPITLVAIALSAAVKLAVFRSEDPSIQSYPVFAYFLWLLLAIIGRTWNASRKVPNAPYRYHAVAGMQVAAIYALLIAAFTYLYYTAIDVDFFANKIADTIAQLEAKGASQKNIKQFMKNARTIYDPFLHSTLVMFGFLILGVIYSLIIGGLVRKMPR